MWNPFRKKTAEEKKSKEELKTLKQMSSLFGNMQKLENRGLMRWEERNRRLFIAEPLALVMLRSEEKWRGFVTNVFLWRNYLEQQKAWEDKFRHEELKAIREAKKQVAILTKAETERIRRATRESISMSDLKAPKMKPYEIFILRDSRNVHHDGGPRNSEEEAQEKADILAVGAFDPETENISLTSWEEVSSSL